MTMEMMPGIAKLLNNLPIRSVPRGLAAVCTSFINHPSFLTCYIYPSCKCAYDQGINFQPAQKSLIRACSQLCHYPARKPCHLCVVHRIGMRGKSSARVHNLPETAQVFNHKHASVRTILILRRMFPAAPYNPTEIPCP